MKPLLPGLSLVCWRRSIKKTTTKKHLIKDLSRKQWIYPLTLVKAHWQSEACWKCRCGQTSVWTTRSLGTLGPCQLLCSGSINVEGGYCVCVRVKAMHSPLMLGEQRPGPSSSVTVVHIPPPPPLFFFPRPLFLLKLSFVFIFVGISAPSLFSPLNESWLARRPLEKHKGLRSTRYSWSIVGVLQCTNWRWQLSTVDTQLQFAHCSTYIRGKWVSLWAPSSLTQYPCSL